jgi:hypothetical protein
MDWRITRHPVRGPHGRRVALVCALAIAGWLLDRYYPLGAAPAHVAFWGIFVTIVSAIAGFVHSAGDVVLAALVTTVNYIRLGVTILGRALKSGVFELGRGTARVLRAVKTFALDTLPRFVRWSYDKLLRFSTFLKQKFAPVLRWLHTVKDHLDGLYKRFVRPVIDTIEFIRALNRTLQIFHINILRELDSVLAQIERRIEEPFLWVRSKITELENFIDRIVTFDGLIQRVTLIASMSKYAPHWIAGFWNRQIDPTVLAGDERSRTREYPVDEPSIEVEELAAFYRGDAGRMQDEAEELIAIWREAAAVDAAARRLEPGNGPQHHQLGNATD